MKSYVPCAVSSSVANNKSCHNYPNTWQVSLVVDSDIRSRCNTLWCALCDTSVLQQQTPVYVQFFFFSFLSSLWFCFRTNSLSMLVLTKLEILEREKKEKKKEEFSRETPTFLAIPSLPSSLTPAGISVPDRRWHALRTFSALVSRTGIGDYRARSCHNDVCNTGLQY